MARHSASPPAASGRQAPSAVRAFSRPEAMGRCERFASSVCMSVTPLKTYIGIVSSSHPATSVASRKLGCRRIPVAAASRSRKTNCTPGRDSLRSWPASVGQPSRRAGELSCSRVPTAVAELPVATAGQRRRFRPAGAVAPITPQRSARSHRSYIGRISLRTTTFDAPRYCQWPVILRSPKSRSSGADSNRRVTVRAPAPLPVDRSPIGSLRLSYVFQPKHSTLLVARSNPAPAPDGTRVAHRRMDRRGRPRPLPCRCGRPVYRPVQQHRSQPRWRDHGDVLRRDRRQHHHWRPDRIGDHPDPGVRARAVPAGQWDVRHHVHGPGHRGTSVQRLGQ